MAVKVEVNYCNSVLCDLSVPETFAYLADAEKSVPPNFPGLENFTKSGTDLYHWEFEKVGQGGYDIQIHLATRIIPKAPDQIQLSSIAGGKSNGMLQGHWRLGTKGEKTEATFDIKLDLELPLPFFLKAVAAPVAQKELTKLFDRYLTNVGKALTK